MKRHVIAALLLGVLGPQAMAQPDPVRPADLLKAPPPPKLPVPTIIPIPIVPPPTGFYKTGPVLVGADGYYPFDTGDWLLGDYLGLTRQRGSFVMVGPFGEVVHNMQPNPYYYPTRPWFHKKCCP